MADQPQSSNGHNQWRFEPDLDRDSKHSSRRILYLESYGAGSHLRIARLFQRYSRHAVDLIVLDRNHWRWLALAGHRNLEQAIAHLRYPAPDLVVCSGPAAPERIISSLSRRWVDTPFSIYFHESQWSYPVPASDPRPYLVGHLEALEAAHSVWFNSDYHRQDFFASAMSAPSRQVRMLAEKILSDNWHKTETLYPPVSLERRPPQRTKTALEIAWAARWEREKRPDVFVDALMACVSRGLRPTIHLLGSSIRRPISELPPELRILVSDVLGYPCRKRYEQALAASTLWVSTAEHEFFGVAALEAALAGAVPLLPRALAYPETLPSAPSYRAGDANDLASLIVDMASRPAGSTAPWRLDAERFLPTRAVASFDSVVDRITAEK